MGGAALTYNQNETTTTTNRQITCQLLFLNQQPQPQPLIQTQFEPVIGTTFQNGTTYYYKCTYEAFPERYYEQQCFECISCWGVGSAYRVCLICAKNCHKGHQVVESLPQNQRKVICDCGRMQHKTELCTGLSASLLYVKQGVYKCIDCFDQQNVNYVGVCIACSRKCHKDHRIAYAGMSDQFRCCCGLEQCKRACVAKRN